MPITISGDGGIAGVTNLDGGDFECATLVASGDTTLGPQAAARASLFVDDSANSVGINTTTPAAAVFLEVADATDPIVSLNNTGNGEVRLGCTSSLGYVGTNSNHPLNLRANNTNYLKVDTNGNIGLGALNTNYTLDITKNFTGENSIAVFNNINSGVVARASLKVGYDATAHLEIYRLGGGAPIYYDTKQSSSSHNFLVNGTQKFIVTANGEIGVGITSTPSAAIHANETGDLGLVLNTNGTTSTTGRGGQYTKTLINGTSSIVTYYEFRNEDTTGANDLLLSHATTGEYGVVGHELTATGAPQSRLRFYAGGTSVGFWNKDGTIKFNTSGGGLDFSLSEGAGATSSTLDDYEEGTWTPQARDNFSGGNQGSFSFQEGFYTKIGNQVNIWGRFSNVDTTGMIGSYDMCIAGLPFTNGLHTNVAGQCSVVNTTFNTSAIIGLRLEGARSSFRFLESQSAGTVDFLTVSQFTSGTADAFFHMVYFV